MERVSFISGGRPVLLVAPHGYQGDDENTAVLAEQAAGRADCNALINRGWERSDAVDFMLDKADCNDVSHCHQDVVREEFLEPILRFVAKTLRRHPLAFIFYIHGMSNRHRQLAGNPLLDAVVGHGAGIPNSFSCESWRKDLFVDSLNAGGLVAYDGKAGGVMSGWARGNMNQLFRKWYPTAAVQSLQVEVAHALRSEPCVAALTAASLATAVTDTVRATGYTARKKCNSY